MGRLQTSVGLVTGTDIVGTVDKLVAISARPRDRLVARTKDLQSQQTAITELMALVIGVQFAGRNLNATSQYQARKGTSSDSASLSVAASADAQLGTLRARATQIASTQSFQSRNLATDASAQLGLVGEINVRAGGFINASVSLADLNQGRGVQRGAVRITDRAGNTEEIDLSQAATIDDVIRTINDASTVRVRASTVGDSIQLTDLTGSSAGNLRVSDVGDGETAADLGLQGIDVAASSATGTDIYGNITDTAPTGLQGVSLSRLAGGNGLGSLTSISINATDGTVTQINLSSATTTQDIVRLINDSGAPVEARLNDSATGFRVRDLSGGSANAFSISSTDNTASKLGLAQSSSSRVINGSDLQNQFVATDTKLASLRQGRGIDDGLIVIRNSQGASASISLLDSKTATVGDFINRINASNLSVTASINATGDGIAVTDASGGAGRLSITDTGGNTSAAELGLTAASLNVANGNGNNQIIDARQSDTIKVVATDSLQSIVTKINDFAKFATASIVTGENGSKSISLRSARSGEAGRLSITSSGFDLGLQATSQGKDAVLELEQSDGSKRQIRSADGVFTDIEPGVTLTAKEVTEQLVTINVDRDTQPAVTNVKAFVSQYNKMIDKLKALTVFNAETNEVGLLFGSSEALRIETGYTRLLSGQVFGAGSMKSIGELGMGFSETGKLELDEAKLVDKLANNSAAVTEFLTKADTGLLARLNGVAERIAGEGNSLLLTRNETLSVRIQRNTQQTESLNVRLNNERERLLRQYFAAEQAISKLQSNQSALNQIRFFGGSGSE